jgi:hypothetical protein
VNPSFAPFAYAAPASYWWWYGVTREEAASDA